MQTQQQKKTIDYDIAISGGGIVGCLAALALSKHSHLKLVLLETFAPNNILADSLNATQNNQFDERVIALAGESLRFLGELGVDIHQILGQNIEHIHVSDKGHIGQVRLSAEALGRSALGKVVSIKALGLYLLEKVKACKNVQYCAPASIQQARRSQDYISLDVKQAEQLSQIKAKLLLVCDGSQASTRELLGLSKREDDYGQTGIITNVRMQLPHNNTAYERFSSQGPIAFLPMHGAEMNTVKSDDFALRTMSVVWCMHTHKAQAAIDISESDFKATLQKLFGYKLGNIEAISKRVSYPLVLSETVDYASHRTICLGNAAQSLHPIAGQGFNLGIRDVFDLIQSIDPHSDVGSYANIKAYKHSRDADKTKTIKATSSLVRIFSNQYAPLVIARNFGLLAMNKSAYAKQSFANFAMGKRG